MGSTSSKHHKNEDYHNKDVDEKRKLLTGFQMSRDADGVEANFQIAFWKKTKKNTKRLRLKRKNSQKRRN